MSKITTAPPLRPLKTSQNSQVRTGSKSGISCFSSLLFLSLPFPFPLFPSHLFFSVLFFPPLFSSLSFSSLLFSSLPFSSLLSLPFSSFHLLFFFAIFRLTVPREQSSIGRTRMKRPFSKSRSKHAYLSNVSMHVNWLVL